MDITLTQEQRDKKARLRALRKMLQLTQKDVAELAGVQVFSAKRWELLDYTHVPPAFIMEKLEQLLAAKAERVAYLLEVADNNPDVPVYLPLYTSAEHYAASANDPRESWRFVNSISLTVGEQLIAEGREVVFTYDYAQLMDENNG